MIDVHGNAVHYYILTIFCFDVQLSFGASDQNLR